MDAFATAFVGQVTAMYPSLAGNPDYSSIVSVDTSLHLGVVGTTLYRVNRTSNTIEYLREGASFWSTANVNGFFLSVCLWYFR